MFCYKCGALAKDGAKFCEECGASLNSPEQTEQETPKKRSLSRGAIIGLLIFLVVGVVAAVFLISNSGLGQIEPQPTPAPLTAEILLEEVNYYIEQNNAAEKYSADYVEPLQVNDRGEIETEKKHRDYRIKVETDDDGVVTGWSIHFSGKTGTYTDSMMNVARGLNFYVESFMAATAGSDWKDACTDYEKWAKSGFKSGSYSAELADFEYSNLSGGNFTAAFSTNYWFINVDCEMTGVAHVVNK